MLHREKLCFFQFHMLMFHPIFEIIKEIRLATLPYYELDMLALQNVISKKQIILSKCN